MLLVCGEIPSGSIERSPGEIDPNRTHTLHPWDWHVHLMILVQHLYTPPGVVITRLGHKQTGAKWCKASGRRSKSHITRQDVNISLRLRRPDIGVIPEGSEGDHLADVAVEESVQLVGCPRMSKGTVY